MFLETDASLLGWEAVQGELQQEVDDFLVSHIII